MAEITISTDRLIDKKAAVIFVDVDTGEIMAIQGINGATKYDDMPLNELTSSYGKMGAGYATVAWITYTHSSPGCIQIIGGTPVKIC